MERVEHGAGAPAAGVAHAADEQETLDRLEVAALVLIQEAEARIFHQLAHQLQGRLVRPLVDLCEYGVTLCFGALTPSTRLVSIREGDG